ncbi:MAG: NAD(P)/FAD-dependent oxidoreductase [Nitrosopumilaceae archaeon]|nr:NAD(P)/FAD-dependent oxidoreductase [Nitrosopumilaceae archaeon]
MVQQYDVTIVGAGPAGLSAGIFVTRQKTPCLIISKDLGGQMNLIPKLENYPGTIMSSGPLLAKTLESQYLAFGGEITYDIVENIDETEEGFKIKTARAEYFSKAIILAPGKVPNNLGLANESMFANRGIHYCTKCDAPFYQGRSTAVVGVGGYLVEAGILLSRMAAKVYLIYKGGKLGGDQDMITSLEKKENVELVPNSNIKAINGSNTLQEIIVEDSLGHQRTIPVAALFIEMGFKINLDFVKHLVKLNQKGEIEVTEDGKTFHIAIFAAGDATTTPYKQIVSACGDGAIAGLSAFNYIEKLKGKPGIRIDWKKQIMDTVFHY